MNVEQIRKILEANAGSEVIVSIRPEAGGGLAGVLAFGKLSKSALCDDLWEVRGTRPDVQGTVCTYFSSEDPGSISVLGAISGMQPIQLAPPGRFRTT